MAIFKGKWLGIVFSHPMEHLGMDYKDYNQLLGSGR